MTSTQTYDHLRKLMSNDGPNLREVLEGLAMVCENRAELDREHVLTRDEAELVWAPAAVEIRKVKEFVEKVRLEVPRREIPS